MKVKIKPEKAVLTGLIALIVVSFIIEAIVIKNGYEWLSKQFYILRCFKDILFIGIIFYVSYHKIFKKNIVISKDIRTKPYHRAELIISIITAILCVFQVFIDQWNKPDQTAGFLPVFIAGTCYLTIPLMLEQFVLNPQEKKRKRGYIIMVVFEIIGAYMTLCFVSNYLVIFGIVG